VNPGLYIHIPFCKTKCSYCHFISVPYDEPIADRYRKAVLWEIRRCNALQSKAEVDSIYFGGGTPGLIPSQHVSEFIAECRRRFHVSIDCEVSLEANPDTISADKASAYRSCGITRISMGAQSFEDRELKAIGRLHISETILESLGRLRESGFTNINLDLMLGLPLQTAESWRRNLKILDRLAIPHISIYMLDLDEACPLKSLVDCGSIAIPEEDLISDLYLETLDFLSSCGYIQYEISNFARPGFACRHNLKYWMREPVLGFGLGSHSFDGHSRSANYSQLGDYLQAMESGTNPRDWSRDITDRQALEETLFLGLRLAEGVDWNRLRNTNSGDQLEGYEKSLKELGDRGLIQWKDSRIRLTASGMLLSNEIFQIFV
jgi:oxygen-independent coproporphyrinogen III oxidase